MFNIHISNEANSSQLGNIKGISTTSLNENGYVKFAGGLIFQWGIGKTFPIPFPNKCLRVIATIGAPYGNASSNDDIYVVSVSKTGYNTYRNYNTMFFAIGY